ncbi:MAG: HisA/HisF-related TIM barrel protein [Thaumarchaeota archaeon]|nr:HisA/HisF-related TIM barrel protein [Nitrososphaerota archaeon]
METWASINILKGRVVSLLRGDPSTPMEWEMAPLEAAQRWQEEGVDGLHVVDLDRALGSGTNEVAVLSVLEGTRIPVQVAGGIRSVDEALAWLGKRAVRVVIGTMAYVNPDKIGEIIEKTGPRGVALAVDFRENTVLSNGWRRDEKINVFEAIKAAENLGVDAVVVTAVDRAGTAGGPDFGTYEKLRSQTEISILASGGIRSSEDVDQLSVLGLDGVIVGRALYEGAVRPAHLRSRL